MATPSLAEAGCLFGVLEDDELQLPMNMQPNQLFQQSLEEQSTKITSAAPSTQKKKRTHPEPDAEVIALSPEALMATNRFICEVCKKGFQREQNLQLHRRGHNLPWKLKQKSTKEDVKKKIYLCPEPTCVHHHPSRALGDLTGIKKHFYRKHCEKKWKCEKCSKMYAVQSDWRAHSKTCGTKEYRCDCGTLFSRRDSFVTHQAFCDTIGQENNAQINHTNLSVNTSQLYEPSRVIANQASPRRQYINFYDHNTQPKNKFLAAHSRDGLRPFSSFLPQLNGSAIHPSYSSIVYGFPNYHEDLHSSNKLVSVGMMQQFPPDQIPSEHCGHIKGSLIGDPQSLAHLTSSGNNISWDQINPLYGSEVSRQNCNNASASAHLSATALLQKAAQVDSSCSINVSSSQRTLESSLYSSKHDLQASLGAKSFGALFGDQNYKHLHELMSSLGGGGSTARITKEYLTNEETKLSFSQHSKVNVAGGDRLTRDFMGVGQIVGHLGDGLSQNDILHHQQRSSDELKDIDNRI